jgi:hypothetical protein
MMVGAAMQAGINVSPDTPVYSTMLGVLPAGIDPRKRQMKLEHLLSMTGGHFCDDSNDDAPGNEDRMQDQQEERDWYRFILALPMDRTPGEKTIYCSIDAHLAGGVLAKVAGEAPAGTFRSPHRAPDEIRPVLPIPHAEQGGVHGRRREAASARFPEDLAAHAEWRRVGRKADRLARVGEEIHRAAARVHAEHQRIRLFVVDRRASL